MKGPVKVLARTLSEKGKPEGPVRCPGEAYTQDLGRDL